MYDQHVTRETQVQTGAHLSAVNHAPQTDSEAGAATRDCEVQLDEAQLDEVQLDGVGGALAVRASLAEVAPIDAGAAYLETDSAALDSVALDSDDDVDFDESDESDVPPRAPEKPFLSLVAGFDQMFEEIEDQWQERALCAQTDPEAFFPEKGGSTREAKRICLGCEVKDECLEYALANDERFGIWGGLSERERRRLKRGII